MSTICSAVMMYWSFDSPAGNWDFCLENYMSDQSSVSFLYVFLHLWCVFLNIYSLLHQRRKWIWRPLWRVAWSLELALRVNLTSLYPFTSQRSIRATHRSRATRRCLWSTGKSSQLMSGRVKHGHQLKLVCLSLFPDTVYSKRKQ